MMFTIVRPVHHAIDEVNLGSKVKIRAISTKFTDWFYLKKADLIPQNLAFSRQIRLFPAKYNVFLQR